MVFCVRAVCVVVVAVTMALPWVPALFTMVRHTITTRLRKHTKSFAPSFLYLNQHGYSHLGGPHAPRPVEDEEPHCCSQRGG